MDIHAWGPTVSGVAGGLVCLVVAMVGFVSNGS